eukprot:10021443-Lingulodinium_polyedra.AAC.1
MNSKIVWYLGFPSSASKRSNVSRSRSEAAQSTGREPSRNSAPPPQGEASNSTANAPAARGGSPSA